MFKSALLSLFFISTPIISNAYQADPIVGMVEQSSKSVVFIATEMNPFDLSYGSQPGYYEYLRPVYDYLWPSQYAHGSGFVISADGYIVTNAHVVEDATKVMVIIRRSNEMKVCKALVIGKDERSDLAVLKIEEDLGFTPPVLEFGDSNQMRLGEQVVCIGSPCFSQLETSVTAGIVSGLDRNNFGKQIEGFIQTDAVLNPGNSGCPVLNAKGEVIGVVSWGFNHYLGYEGISFAIPSHVARHIVKQIISKGRVSQGFLGVKLEDDSESAFDVYHFDHKEGAFIKSVIKNSPAEKAGLESGDLILKVDQVLVTSSKSLRNQIAILEPGRAVRLTYDRHGELFEANIELGDEKLANTYSNLEEPIVL